MPVFRFCQGDKYVNVPGVIVPAATAVLVTWPPHRGLNDLIYSVKCHNSFLGVPGPQNTVAFLSHITKNRPDPSGQRYTITGSPFGTFSKIFFLCSIHSTYYFHVCWNCYDIGLWVRICVYFKEIGVYNLMREPSTTPSENQVVAERVKSRDIE